MSSFIPGFLVSLTLILAIGAQNAFVLRQGLRRDHVFWVCTICAASDAILIAAGIVGFGALAEAVPWFEPLMRFSGATFLIWYGARNLRLAWAGGAAMDLSGPEAQSQRQVVMTVLALTWLNPHVYLDTVALIGSISSQYDSRLGFGLGAVLASGAFFFSLGYGAGLLAPLFAKPRSWQMLDTVIGLTMWALAVKLIFF